MKITNYIGLFLMALLIWLIPTHSKAQISKFLPKKKDIPSLLLCGAAGHLKGWGDEVRYHPNAFFRKYPNANRAFWDIRVQDEPTFLNTEWDADHLLSTANKALFVTAIVIKIGDKKKWYYYVIDAGWYWLAHGIGFTTSYNIIHKNKF